MSRGAKGPAGPNKSTQIADLRASLRAPADADIARPPKARRAPKRDSEEDWALKAERLAMAQHTTSLLKGHDSKKPYVRPGERPERKTGGLIAQLIIVVLIAGGVAYALDPSIVPAEWTAKAHAFVSQYVKL